MYAFAVDCIEEMRFLCTFQKRKTLLKSAIEISRKSTGVFGLKPGHTEKRLHFL